MQDTAVDQFEHHLKLIDNAKKEIAKVIIGQNEVVDLTLTTLISGGHVLLIGVPGLAKTLLVETTAKVLGLSSARVQCTPDLMPADILGSEVLEEGTKGKRSFRFIEGPVFTQFFMADEINRASPRTQSALLQAMQEKEVSIAGKAQKLPEPFHVLATQNPIEQEGTYPLPEAQLDRFLMQINVDYPDETAERNIVLSTTTNNQTKIKAVMRPEDLLDIQHFVRDIPVGEKTVDMMINLVRKLRPGSGAHAHINNYVSWAPGPRGSQGLMLAARAYAMLQGRTAAVEGDVLAVAAPVLRHRMALNFKANADGITVDQIIHEIAETL
ncbi:MAG: AAA domain-containing protein [Alphaproteobacteria bacterium]|nr:AAA domain-containing protein [Alphaproteobacteria bacterium]